MPPAAHRARRSPPPAQPNRPGARRKTLKLKIGIDGKSYEVEVEITEDDTAPKPHYIPAQSTTCLLYTS